MSLRSLLPLSRDRLPMRSDGDLVSTLHRDLDRLFDSMMTSTLAPIWSDHMVPRLDVRDTDKGLEVTAELPGVEEDDIDLTLDDGLLTIRAEKKTVDETGPAARDALGVHVSERAYGTFLRSIPLPFEVADTGVEATFAKGVLTIVLPRSEKARESSRKIPLTRH